LRNPTLFALSAVHAEQIPLDIGAITIQFPMEADYVRVSQAQPKLFALVQAALPPTNRLVEALMTRADVTRLEQGGVAADIYYEVQVQRDFELRQISIDDWVALKPQLTAGMSQDDMDKVMAADSGSNDRMSAVAGKQVSFNVGKVGAPEIYRETTQSVNYGMLVPMQVRIGNDVKSGTMAAAGSFTIARNKLIYIYAFSTDASVDNIKRLRAHLNDVVDRTIALNPSDSAVRSTGAFDWSSVRRSALIGGAIGGLIGLIGWFVKRRKA